MLLRREAGGGGGGGPSTMVDGSASSHLPCEKWGVGWMWGRGPRFKMSEGTPKIFMPDHLGR